MKHEKMVRKNEIFKGRIFDVRCDDVIGTTDKPEKREIVLHKGGVGVVPIDSNGDVILVRQYRYAFDIETLEIPAGKLDAGETPLTCGIRELKEEAGISGDMTYLSGFMPSPGFTNEIIHIYLAENLTFGKASPDEGEEVEIIRMPLDTAVEKIECGEITDGKTVIGILMAAMRRLKTNGKH